MFVRLAIIALIVAFVVFSTVHAEGVFESKLIQVQPGFESRDWIDKGSGSVPTKISLSECQVNKGGEGAGSTPLKSVSITLYRNNGIIATKTQACGTYNFGQQLEGTYRFVVSAINGYAKSDKTFFLNADPVSVSY